MRRGVRWVLLLAVVCGGGAPATGPTTAPDVAALVAQLDADDWRDRDAAAERLVAMGEVVRPAVVEAAGHSASPEVRSRAVGVLVRLDQALTERPTLVTLHAKDADPRDVLSALAKQAGAPIRFWPDSGWAGRRGPTVTVDWVDRPFWPAVLDACRAGGVGTPFLDKQRTITVQGAGYASGALAGSQVFAGPWLVVAGVPVYRDAPAVPPGVVAAAAGDVLPVWLFADPKVRPAGAPTIRLTVAQDERGRSLLPDGGSSKRTLGGAISTAALPLNLGDRTARRIAVLRGEVQCDLAEASARLQVEDAAKAGGAVHTVGPYAVQVRACQIVGPRVSYMVEIHTHLDPSDLQADECFLHLEDAAGRTVDERGSSGVGNLRNGGRVYFVRAVADGPVTGPVRLVWDVATRTRRASFPFELRGLALRKE